ncbi:MAG: hypothetical protein VW907_02075, partial [Opitutae bacterium]
WATQSGGGGGGGVTVSDTPPSSPSSGDLWFESDTGTTFVYYVETDASSSQWVEVGSSNSYATGGDGAIQYADSGGLAADDANFVWDATNARLGIGTASPATYTHIYAGSSGVTTQNSAARLIVEDSSSAGIAINTSNTGIGYVRFVDPDNNAAGGMSYAHTDDDLKLRTAGSDRLTIDSSGRVGIGTASPSELLDIDAGTSGSVELTTTGGRTIQLTANDAEPFLSVGSTTSHSAAIMTNGVRRLTVNSSGRVGIGTSSPADMLELSGGNFISDGHVTAQSGGADGGIVLGQTFGPSFVGLRTAGMSENSSGEYILMTDGTDTFFGAGTGGTTYIRGGANSTDYELRISGSLAQIKGDLTIVDNGNGTTGKLLLPNAGGDGGLALQDWTGSAFFGAIQTANMTSTEYMMISAGTHTYISAATSCDVFIRAGANSGTHEIWLDQSTGKTYLETTGGVHINQVLNMEPISATEGGEIALLHGTSGLQDAILDNYHSGSTYFRLLGDSTAIFRVRLDTRLYALGGTGRDVYINSNDTLVYNTSTLDLKQDIVTVTAESVDDQGRSLLERARMLEALEYEYSTATPDAVPGNRYIGLAAEHVHDLFPTATTDYLDYDEDENGDPIDGTGRPVGWDNRAMIGVLWALWRDSDTKLQDALNRISVLEAG